MKNFILVAAVLCAFSAPSFAGINVPTTVQTALLQRYPYAAQVQWTKENGQYKAQFVLEDQNMTAVFQENGPLVETDVKMNYNQLPPTVAKSFEGKEGKLVGVMVTRIELPTGDVKYVLQYRTKEGKKTEILYNLDGVELK